MRLSLRGLFKSIFVSVLAFLIVGTSLAWERDGDPKSKDPHSIQIFGWKTDLDGSVNALGMSLDFKSEASMRKEFGSGANFRLPLNPKIQLVFSLQQFRNKGTTLKPITFDSQKYAAGADIHFESKCFEVGASHSLSENKSGYFELLYGLRFQNAEVQLSQFVPLAGSSKTGDWRQRFFIPYLGLGGGVKLSKRVLANSHIRMTSLNFGSQELKSVDIDISLAVRLNAEEENETREWYAAIGYKKFIFTGNEGNNSADVGFSGPTFGIMGRF